MENIVRPDLTPKNIGRARICLDDISQRYDENDESKDFQRFIDASRRATTDTARRIYRSRFLCEKLDKALKD